MHDRKVITSETLARRHKAKGVAIITMMTWFFLYNLLPENFWVQYFISYIPEQAQYVAASALISSFLLIIFYHSDPLFKQKNSTSDWIKELYASNLLTEKFGLSLHEANALWFKYFNQWQHKEHPNHSFLKKSHSASYNARLVYFIVYISLFYAIVAFIAAIFSLATHGDWSLFIVSGSFGLGGCILYVLNRPPRLKAGNWSHEPSGVWRSVEASFLECKSLFSREIVDKCEDIDCVVKEIESESRKWMK